MKIRKMTATFGRLDKAELSLEDGLNLLELPNEGGKSTWCVFLLAMFYGIDTSRRAAKGTIPAKTKYKPWSGAAMEGRIELEWQGREITIERRSKGRVPMGEFRAYETASGLPVRELTAENCGLLLLGVEEAVFERSAFLRQAGLAVTQTGALEQRLGALVTTGEETVSYSETERRLRDWRNACRHNQTGELPRLERQLAETEDTLAQIHALQEQSMGLRAEEERQNAELLHLSRLERGLRAAENRKKREAVARAEERSEVLREAADAAREQAAGLPPEETLRDWQREWVALQAERRAVPVAAAAEPEPPVIPSAFAGKSAEEIRKTAEQATWNYDAYEKAAQPGKPSFPWPALIAVVLGMLAFLLPVWYPGAVLLAAAVVLLAVHFRSAAAGRREAENAARAAGEILRQYGAESRDELLQAAERAAAVLENYDRARTAARAAEQQRQAQAEAVEQKERAYLTRLRQALPDFGDEPVAALSAALTRLLAAAQAERDATAEERHYAALAETLRPAEEDEAEPVTGNYTLPEVLRQKERTEAALQNTRARLERGQGRISALGDPAALEARREELQGQIDEQKERYEALTLAMEALERANDTLQTRFAPEISRQAAELLGKLTGGRYDKVLLDQSLAVSARETGEVTARELAWLSCGTADQLYLSVRLAICHAILPSDTPLVLDDALVNFDDKRLRQALDLLTEEAETRQILLFTCQNREKTALSSGEK